MDKAVNTGVALLERVKKKIDSLVVFDVRNICDNAKL